MCQQKGEHNESLILYHLCMLYCLYILQCIKNLCKKHGEEKEETAQKMDKATIQKQKYKKAAAVTWRMKSAGVKVQS